MNQFQDTSNGLNGLFENPTPAPNGQLGNNNPQEQPSFWDDMTNSDEFSAPESDYQEPVQQPVQEQQQNQNDMIRYQYFQAEADRVKNELAKKDKEIAELQQKFSQLQQTQQQPQAPVQEDESFPEWNKVPPQLPTDPNDPNALYSYIIAKDNYDKEYNAYMLYKTEWIDGKAKERVAKTQEQLVREQNEQMQKIQMQQNLAGVASQLQQKYGATPEQANEFISFMANNENFNLENMWKLYSTVSMNQQPNNWTPPIPNNYMQQPVYGYNPNTSQQFNQYRNSQSIPNTVGVFSQNQQQTDPMKSWLDGLISQSNAKRNFFR